MAKGKNNSSSNINDIKKQNARAAGRLNHLIAAMKDHINEAELTSEGNPENVIAQLKNLQREYLEVMGNLSSICKFPSEEVKQLKASARKYYDKSSEMIFPYEERLVEEAKIKNDLSVLANIFDEYTAKLRFQSRGNPKNIIEGVLKIKQRGANYYQHTMESCKYSNEEINQLKEKADVSYQKLNIVLDRELEVQGIKDQKIINSLKIIDTILDDLNRKIGSEAEQNPHRQEDSLKVANQLLLKLKDARNNYENGLTQGKNIALANGWFHYDYTNAIEDAQPALEKDLGWGPYLGNLLKALARALITVFTAGHVRPSSEVGMFAKSHSETFKAAKTAELELDSATRGGQLNSLN